MQSIQVALMQKLIKTLTPSSPAYNNTLAFERPSTPKEIEAMLQPGDIIFSRTNSSIYEMARKYVGVSYDHVAVVLSSREVIHISPPIIGTLDVAYIVDPKREPMIIRPKLEDLDKFMLVINNYLGEKYNLHALRQLGLRQLKNKLKTSTPIPFSVGNLKHSRICSDSVLYALIRASPRLEKSLQEELSQTKFDQLGFFMPDEIATILLANDGELLLKSKFQSEYKWVELCSQGGEKLVQVAQKVVAVGSMASSKVSKLTSKLRRVQREEEYPLNRLSGIEVFSLVMGLGHTIGVLTLTNKARFMMLMLNLVIILGHFQEMKTYIRRNLSNL